MTEQRAQRQVGPERPSSAASRDSPLPEVRPDDAFIVFAYTVLRRVTAALTANQPRLESAPTPEEIHQLRVASRRLRVALRLFGRMLPSGHTARFQADLRWFASSLGDVRDLDVYTENFKSYARKLPPEQRADLRGYELYLRRERATARQRATAAVASPRTAALIADLEHFAAGGPSAGALRRWGSRSVRDSVRQSIRRSVGRVRRLGAELTPRARPNELHELRIKTKRLRYELEFFADVYPALKQTANQCKALQDLLGTHQDVYAGTARMRRYAALLRSQGAAGVLPPALVELRKSQFRLARAVRRSFREQWPDFVAAIGAARRLVP